MILTTALSYIWSSVRRVAGLMLGGPYTWIGITFYVVYENRLAISEFFQTGDLMAVIVSFGEKLGRQDQVILQNTEKILSLSASSTEFVFQMFGFRLLVVDTTVLTYLGLMAGIIGALAYILWYFKAFHKGSELVLAGNAPYVYTLPLAAVFYALTIALVRDVNPFVGVISFLQNLGGLGWNEVVNSTSTTAGNSSSVEMVNKVG